jgi:hypothetical protein
MLEPPLEPPSVYCRHSLLLEAVESEWIDEDGMVSCPSCGEMFPADEIDEPDYEAMNQDYEDWLHRYDYA